MKNEPRAGFHSVTPRMVVSDVAGQIAFLRAVFDATGDAHVGGPAEIRIGDSVVLVTAAGDREVFPAFLYVYVGDADAVYARARCRCHVARGAVRHPVRRSAGDGAGPLRERLADRSRCPASVTPVPAEPAARRGEASEDRMPAELRSAPA